MHTFFVKLRYLQIFYLADDMNKSKLNLLKFDCGRYGESTKLSRYMSDHIGKITHVCESTSYIFQSPDHTKHSAIP